MKKIDVIESQDFNEATMETFIADAKEITALNSVKTQKAEQLEVEDISNDSPCCGGCGGK